MPQVLWLGPAVTDLEEIKAFFEDKAAGWGERLTGEILDIERTLSEFPYIGRVSRNITPEHREFLRGNYWIVYRVDPEAVKIVAVIDTRRHFLNAWRSKDR
jgi:plasmid stabilization system protein ParE